MTIHLIDSTEKRVSPFPSYPRIATALGAALGLLRNGQPSRLYPVAALERAVIALAAARKITTPAVAVGVAGTPTASVGGSATTAWRGHVAVDHYTETATAYITYATSDSSIVSVVRVIGLGSAYIEQTLPPSIGGDVRRYAATVPVPRVPVGSGVVGDAGEIAASLSVQSVAGTAGGYLMVYTIGFSLDVPERIEI